MFATFRAGRVLRSIAALMLGLGLLAEPLAGLHARADDDTLCRPAGALHDASAHRVEAGRNDAGEARHHCYICHWLGSFRPLLTAGRRADMRAACASQLEYALAALKDRLPLADVPARAPPA